MNYTITTTKSTHEIKAESLVDLFNSLEKLKRKHCIYNDEILFINKIYDSKLYYDAKNLKNVFSIKNEVFNIPYKITFQNDKQKCSEPVHSKCV